jgi:L,D-transpeptidase ErfK/SrfK
MRFLTVLLALIMLAGAALPALGSGPYSVRFPAAKTGIDPAALTVVGTPQRHVIQKGEDLLEIARHYGLGYNSIGMMHRDWDPFIPPVGTEIMIPTQWIVPEFRARI